jgi:hypothetical protein
MPRRFGRVAGAALILGTLLMEHSALAQPAAGDMAAAQALFDEGKALMNEQRYDRACPKFEESQRLDPSGGTMLALALCHEAEGKTATAWADFNAALTYARRDRRAERESAALEHIRALEAKLTRVRINVSFETPGLEIVRNGAVIGKAQWGTAVPIDPGEVRVEARAPDRKPWQAVVRAEGEGNTVDVAVPALDPLPRATDASPSAPKDDAAPRKPEGSRDLTWVFVSAGVGLAAIGVGTAFGLSAASTWSDAKRVCPGLRCPSDGELRMGEDAKSAADGATISFIVAGAALAAAAIFFFTSSPDPPKAHAARTRTSRSGSFSIGGAL